MSAAYFPALGFFPSAQRFDPPLADSANPDIKWLKRPEATTDPGTREKPERRGLNGLNWPNVYGLLTTTPKNKALQLALKGLIPLGCGTYWIRTSDLMRVKHAL